jgi:hypothetical protein
VWLEHRPVHSPGASPPASGFSSYGEDTMREAEDTPVILQITEDSYSLQLKMLF